jgi:hypothetical protein
MDRCEREYKEAEEYYADNFCPFRGDDFQTMVDFRQEKLDKIAKLFIEKTKDRNPYRCGKKGGYKKWEHKMMDLCGYEYIEGKGWSKL